MHVPRLNFKAWYVAISEGSCVDVGISTWHHYVYADRVWKKTLPHSHTSRIVEHVLEWGGFSRLALSILKLGGSGGMLPRDRVSICPEQGVHMSCIQIQHCQEGGALGRGGGGEGGGGETTLGLCVKSFLPACKEKTTRTSFHNNTGRLAKFRWTLTYLKIRH